jgi:hypothetical protein
MSEKKPPPPINIDSDEERGELSEEGFGDYDDRRNPVPPIEIGDEDDDE